MRSLKLRARRELRQRRADMAPAGGGTLRLKGTLSAAEERSDTETLLRA